MWIAIWSKWNPYIRYQQAQSRKLDIPFLPQVGMYIFGGHSFKRLNDRFPDTVSIAPALVHCFSFQCTAADPHSDGGGFHPQALRYFLRCQILFHVRINVLRGIIFAVNLLNIIGCGFSVEVTDHQFSLPFICSLPSCFE